MALVEQVLGSRISKVVAPEVCSEKEIQTWSSRAVVVSTLLSIKAQLSFT